MKQELLLNPLLTSNISLSINSTHIKGDPKRSLFLLIMKILNKIFVIYANLLDIINFLLHQFIYEDFKTIKSSLFDKPFIIN